VLASVVLDDVNEGSEGVEGNGAEGSASRRMRPVAMLGGS